MCWHFCAISGSFLMHTFYCMAFLFAYFLHLFFCISFWHFIFCLFFCIYFFASFFMHLLLHLFFASLFCIFLLFRFSYGIFYDAICAHLNIHQETPFRQPTIRLPAATKYHCFPNPSKILKPSILVNLTIQSIARSLICLFHSMGLFHRVSVLYSQDISEQHKVSFSMRTRRAEDHPLSSRDRTWTFEHLNLNQLY